MKEENKKTAIELLLVLICLMLALSFIILLTMRIPAEGDCQVTGISFQSNETSHFQNLSMSDGSLHCKFKGEVPLIFFLGR